MFKANIVAGKMSLYPPDAWFYEDYFELVGLRKATRFDYSQVSKIQETFAIWGTSPKRRLVGWVYFVDGKKPLCVLLAPRGRFTMGYRKMKEQSNVELPEWLEQKLGKGRYIRLADPSADDS